MWAWACAHVLVQARVAVGTALRPLLHRVSDPDQLCGIAVKVLE
jgi:hypothetical protein